MLYMHSAQLSCTITSIGVNLSSCVPYCFITSIHCPGVGGSLRTLYNPLIVHFVLHCYLIGRLVKFAVFRDSFSHLWTWQTQLCNKTTYLHSLAPDPRAYPLNPYHNRCTYVAVISRFSCINVWHSLTLALPILIQLHRHTVFDLAKLMHFYYSMWLLYKARNCKCGTHKAALGFNYMRCESARTTNLIKS